MSAYADTSFAVSLYVPDSKSNEAGKRMARLEKPVLISSLGELEVVNAFHLDLFRGEITASDLRAALANFRSDLEAGVLSVRPMSDRMFAEALQLCSKWNAKIGARSLDILQVASAVVLRADRFVTFDERQQRFAKAAGLICR